MRGLPATLLALLSAALLAPGIARAECPSVPEVARLAAAILDRRAPPPPWTGLSMPDALCARERLAAVLAQPFGDQLGWKVMPPDPRLGTTGPVLGALFHGTLRERSGAELPARFGIQPRIAPGLLLRIRDEGVNAAGADHLALLRGIGAVIPFLELPDLVHPQDAPWSAGLLTALNAGVRLGVLGGEIALPPTAEAARSLGALSVTLSDGTRAEAAPLPLHPLDALAWLVGELRAQGRTLRAGEHVAIAGLPRPVEAGRSYAATYAGLAPQPASVAVRLR